MFVSSSLEFFTIQSTITIIKPEYVRLQNQNVYGAMNSPLRYRASRRFQAGACVLPMMPFRTGR